MPSSVKSKRASTVSPPAAQLLLARLTHASGSMPTPDQKQLARQWARRLEGNPLALELAGARLGALEHPQADDQPITLGPGPALEEAIGASWQALQPWEQLALAQVATFRGPFDTWAGAAIVDVGRVPGAPLPWSILASLADASLLRVENGIYSHYASVRQYAMGAVDTQVKVDAARRHGEWFLDRAARRGRPGDGQTLAELSADVPELIAVHQRAMGAAANATAASLACRSMAAVLPVILERGPLAGYEKALTATLNHPAISQVSPALLARVLTARGQVRRHLGQDSAWE